MGVFDFIKGVGSSVFGGDDEAEDVKNLLNEELGGRIQDLEVTFDDGAVSLSGSCDSLATQEKAILLAGNIEGVEKVDGTNLAITEETGRDATVSEQESRFYEIKSGDTLSKIAKEFYGSANKYPKIFEANREVIKDPDKIYPGQMIRIPELSE